MKRAFDIIAALIGLILISPLLLIIAVLIRLRMPCPVLFRQKRAGRFGKPFTIYNFRATTVNHGGSTISVG